MSMSASVPAEWKLAFLGEVITSRQGGTPPKSHRDFWNGDIPFVTAADLTDSRIGAANARSFLTIQGLKSGATAICEPGELLLATRTRVGFAGIADEMMGASQDITVLSATERVDPTYLYWVLEDCATQLQNNTRGTSIQGITRGDVDMLPILLPPLHEQQAIAVALSDVDGLLDSLDALIAKKQAVKQATMQQLLTGRTRLPGFSGEWEMKRLGDILTFLTTASNPRSDLGDDRGASYIHYGDVHALSYPVLDCARQGLPSIDRALVERITPVRDSDLVMVDASEDLDGIGKSVEIRGAQDKTVISGLHTILCRGHSQFWATGFKAYLQFIPAFRNKLVRVATGISVYGISKNQLAEITLMLPAKREQAAIAAVLSDMDAEINALERRRDKTAAIKQAMMQELLTGRVRLVEAR